MLQNQSFKDPQGQEFTAAVVRVQSAKFTHSKRDHVNKRLNIDIEDITKPLVAKNDDTYSDVQELHITYNYWPTQADFDTGNQPYQLANIKNNSYSFELYNSELTKAKYDGLSLEEKCDIYFTDEILPTLV